MNIDELRAVQSRERATDSLQDLRESFYGDVAEYVQGLRDERDRAAGEAADPFSSPEVARLTDEIEMAEQVVEAIYERRVGKLVKQASLAAAGMAAEESGLTPEEQALYDDLVDRISENKRTVLDVVAGEATEAAGTADATDAQSASSTPPESARAEGSAEAGADERPTDEATQVTAQAATAGGPAADPDPADGGRTEPPDPDDAAGETGPADEGAPPRTDSERDERRDESGDDASADVDRTTVRITRDVGEIMGVDEQVYRLESEDVVTLPAANAKPLVDREAAERLDGPDQG